MKTFCTTLIILFISIPCFSSNRYWVGSGAGNWNNILNWSTVSGGTPGASIPAATDIVIFDGANSTDCTIDANVNVAGFTILSTYSGTININTGINVTIASTGFSQAGGTFLGNNGNIMINGAFGLSGGIFTSTSSTLQISNGYNYSGGTFNHNNGTVSFSTTQTISGNATFYNVLFVAGGAVYTVASGTTITSVNNVTINGGFSCTINTGIVEIKGDLTLTSSSNNSVNGGSATFLFNGTGNQHINSSISTIIVGTNERVCNLPNIEINKSSGSLQLNGVINLNGSSWITTAGSSLINPGNSTVNINSSQTFSGQNLTLYNIHIYANSQLITLSPSTYTLSCTNSLTINGGSYYQVNTGVLEILGDLNLINTSNSSVNGGTGTFLFDGPGIQNINSSASGLNNICALPNIQINKTSGSLNLFGIINFSGSSWNTIAGNSIINAGTSHVNVLKTTTISGQNLSLYDLTITGNSSTITINSGVTWISNHLLTFAGGSNWYQINTGTINAKGDVLVTNTNTSNNVGGNALLLFDGSANQTLTGSGISGGGRLPQVQINKTGGTLTLVNTISTDNNWTYLAGNVNSAASTLDFYKTSVIDGQGISGTMAFNHVIFSGFISLGGNMDVDGDFTIRSGVNNRLDVNAANNYQLNIGGNWTNNNSITASSFNQQNGKVVFDGSTAQTFTLSSASDNETFYNLEMNHSGSGLTLNSPLGISNNIHFISGNIVTSASNILTINNTATATGANNNSFVSGPVCKTGNQTFTFPVGKNSFYAPISISAPLLSSNQFTSEYFEADPNPFYPVNNKDISLDHVSRCEYWILNRTTGTSNVTVTLSWDTRSCLIDNLVNLMVARWDGAQWRDHGNGGYTGSTSAGTLLTMGPVNSFSPFTFASTTVENPLPIELIDFTAECKNGNVDLEWRTSSEINNDYFDIEQSTNTIDWKTIKTIQGVGNSNIEQSYAYTDNHNYSKINYYRLSQTDFNGIRNNLKIISIENCNKENEKNDFEVYPNPASTKLIVTMEGNDIERSIFIINPSGQKVLEQKIIIQTEIDLAHLPSGIYYIYLNNIMKKLIKL